MIRVIITTITGLKTDLFPDNTLLQEVYNRYHLNFVGSVNAINGNSIQEEDLNKHLHELCDHFTVKISSIPKLQAITEESSAAGGFFINEESLREVYNSLFEIKKSVEKTIKMLETQCPDLVLPF